MKKKLSATVLRELKDQGYSAIIGAGQSDDSRLVYTPSKEPTESIIISTTSTHFAEDDIIILSDEKIDSLPEVFFEGKEVVMN